MFRHPKNVDNLLPIYREAVSKFLNRAPLEESIVIFDGPGPGCSTHVLIMSLLGIDRLLQLKAVHFFSNSGYAGLLMDAKQKGQMKICRDDISCFHRNNQRIHQIRFLFSALLFMESKLLFKRWFFCNKFASDTLRSVVTEQYAESAVKNLPPNFHFWTYEETTKRFCDIHANSHYNHWSLTEMATSMVTVAWLYEPFEKDGFIFSDALCCRDVRNVFHILRNSSQNVLFWHMNRHGQINNTLFVKAHQYKSGNRRLVSDFALFLIGLDNPEFNRSGELGLFDMIDQ